MYGDRIADKAPGSSPVFARRRSWGGTPVWAAAAVAVVLLVISGAVYRPMASHLGGNRVARVDLPIPLREIPLRIDGWVGEDLEIPSTTQTYMRRNFADDYVSRRYVNATEGVWADIYLVYCSSLPAGILGHKPSVCYPNNGWILDSTETSRITSRAGRPIDCLIHRLHKPAPSFQAIVVVNFYILNGQTTSSENDFSGPWARRPNIAGDPARYVAQVQVSSILEHSARVAAEEMVDLLLTYLPDADGRVRAAEEKQTSKVENQKI